MKKEKFGSFIKFKRINQGLSLCGFADKLEISPVYLCNIEKNRHAAPSADIIKKIAEILKLEGHELFVLYDLAAESKHKPSTPIDISEYVMNNTVVRSALRLAQNVDASEEDWNEFIFVLKNKYGSFNDEQV